MAITGVAGPEPDEDGNPVGLMHVAVAVRGEGLHHQAHAFGPAQREETRKRVLSAALELTEAAISPGRG